MTTTTATPDLATARARNEATWRAAAVALYAGDIEEFLAHWTAEPRYSVAYPVDGIPPTVEGRDQFRALFGGFGAATTHIEVHDVRFHQTDDPDVALVEERMVADLVGRRAVREPHGHPGHLPRRTDRGHVRVLRPGRPPGPGRSLGGGQ